MNKSFNYFVRPVQLELEKLPLTTLLFKTKMSKLRDATDFRNKETLQWLAMLNALTITLKYVRATNNKNQYSFGELIAMFVRDKDFKRKSGFNELEFCMYKFASNKYVIEDLLMIERFVMNTGISTETTIIDYASLRGADIEFFLIACKTELLTYCDMSEKFYKNVSLAGLIQIFSIGAILLSVVVLLYNILN